MATYNLLTETPATLERGDVLNVPSGLYGNQYRYRTSITLPPGYYHLFAWGAQGYGEYGGKGGYAAARMMLRERTAVYLRAGTRASRNVSHASDVRLRTDDLNHRLLVAAAGGASGSVKTANVTQSDPNAPGGFGGGWQGGDGTIGSSVYGRCGTFSEGGAASGQTGSAAGTFGQRGLNGGSDYYGVGGDGWYGGSSGGQRADGTAYPGGGGSGFAFDLSYFSMDELPQGYALTAQDQLASASLRNGTQYITEPDGSHAYGHAGEGYVRITISYFIMETPENFRVGSLAERQVTLNWDAVDRATSYKITRNGAAVAAVSATSYTDSGITPGGTYVYTVTAASDGNADSEPAVLTVRNPGKLAAPTGFSYSGLSESSVTLSWNAVPNASSYRLFRNGTGPVILTATRYTDPLLAAGTEYTYTLTAAASGFYDSDAASLTLRNPPKLPTPTGLAASVSMEGVTLTWNASAHAELYSVGRTGWSSPDLTGNTTLLDDDVRFGQTYTYTVTAIGSGYYDSGAASVSAAVNARLAPPSIAEESQTQDSVSLSVTRTGSRGTTVLLRDGAELGRTQAGQWRYTDTGLQAKKYYQYAAYTFDPDGELYPSETASVYVQVGRDYTNVERQRDYLRKLRQPFTKLCRLRFLNPNNTTAFVLDNRRQNRRSRAFIADGSVTANLQNGQRLSATVTLSNVDEDFSFQVNKIWFGQRVALDEGLVLSNGEEYWRQTGVFILDNPQERIDPGARTVTWQLVDKWADLDGTLGGNLEGTYEAPVGTNIFRPVAELLKEDRGNGQKTDNVDPVFTEYYNELKQELPDGTEVSMVLSPYTLTVDGDGGTTGGVVLGLAGMVNAWVGYDNTGRLRLDPSQDDILDKQKAVLYRFSPEEATLLGLAYTVKKEDVYNDYIVVGEQLDGNAQPAGRAQNLDPRSDTCISLIGRKTKRESASGYATDRQCMDLAEWRLKRSGILQKAVSVSCSQMFHIELNSLVEIVRTDKPGSPIERHLVQGYTRPLSGNGAMTISAVSVNDFPAATVTPWSGGSPNRKSRKAAEKR